MCRGAAVLAGVMLCAGTTGNFGLRGQSADAAGAARQHYDAATQAALKRDAASTRRAIAEFREAARLWLGGDDRGHAAAAEEAAGRLSYFVGDYTAAQGDLARALEDSRAAKDRKTEAASLYGLARVYAATGDGARAAATGEQALALRRELKDRAGEGAALQDLGWAYFLLGDDQKAFSSYEGALAIREEAHDELGIGLAQYGMGSVYWAWGEPEKAIQAYERALASYRSVKHEAGVANTLNSGGLAYADIGEYHKAIAMYDEAEAIWERLQQPAREVLALNNLGLAYAALGEPLRATGFYNRALNLAGGPDTRPRSYILQNLGDANAGMKRYAAAIEEYRASLELKRDAGDRFGQGYTLTRLGEAQLALGGGAEAMASFDEALKLDRFTGARGGEAATLAAMARANALAGKPDEARKNMREAVDIVEGLYAGVSSRDLQTTFFANRQSYYEFYIGLLMHLDSLHPDAGYNREALEVSERSRARTLLDSLAEARSQIRAGAPAELLERERSLRNELHGSAQRLEALAGGKVADAELLRARGAFDTALRKYNEVEASIRVASPRYAALMAPQALTAEAIQKRVLDPDTLLLEFSLGREHSYAWLVSQDGVASAELPPGARIEALAHDLYEGLNARNRNPANEGDDEERLRLLAADAAFDRRARQLAGILFGPFAGRFGKRRLAIVADGALHYVPFAALPLPGSSRPLVATNPVVMLPSASTIALLRERGPAAGVRKRTAVIADPVFDAEDARIPRRAGREGVLVSARSIEAAPEYTRLRFSGDEADGIEALEGKARVRIFRDFAANRTLFFDGSLRGYGTLHIASHTVIDNERPALSRVVLSRVDASGNARDGYLRLFEVYNLNLDADLVVLSACRTALGREVRGEGLAGLTRGFLYAGASRVVASLWNVQDRATAELMRRFYAHLVREPSPSAALWAAEREMAGGTQWSNPYYWAAFTIQGDWK